ncbi:MAG: LysR family transcriptional regulator AphB [Psychromonas sp.]|jgi:LysR family transcriptional regulator AphB|uniref:LysR family transcriptional regulator n=1 Tax=Psychromonas sp. TaxID=1884585 RepID=UPI0039E2AE94
MNKTIYGMIDDLYLLCIVIDKTSVAAASFYLEIPTSTISRRISSLEEKLNAKLLTKKGRNITATAFGLELFHNYQSLFNDLNVDILNKKARHGEVAGKLKLVVPSLFYQHTVKAVLSTFLHKYPKVELDLVLSEERIKPQLDTDIIISFKPNIDEDVIARPLFETSHGIYISATLFAEGKVPRNLQELRNSRWIGPSGDKIQLVHSKKKTEEFEGLQTITVNDVQSAIEFAEAGIGVATLPIGLVQNNKKLMRIFPEYQQPKRHAYLIYKERKYQTKATQILIKILLKEIVLLPTN